MLYLAFLWGFFSNKFIAVGSKHIFILMNALQKQELSHDSIARLNCALPITKTISVIR